MNSEKQYIDLYRQCRDVIDAGSHDLINRHRAAALDYLKHKGLPTTRDERFKYLDVGGIFAPDYGINLKRRKMVADLRTAYRCSVHGLDSSLFFVFDDRIEAKDGLLPDGEDLFVGSLVDFATKYPDTFNSYYNRLPADGVVSLNTLLSQDGVVVRVGDGFKCEKTIQIVNLTLGNMPVMTNRRLLVIMGKGAEASLLLCDHSVTSHPHLTTEVAELWLEEDSNLHLCGIEETNDKNNLLRTTQVVQKQRSRLSFTDVTLHNGVTRHTLNVHLDGEEALTQVSGLVIGGGTQRIDNNLLVSHDKGSCESNILYKYVLDDEAVGAFAGKVYVAEGAQKSESQETNANLCVSPTAHVYTQPMLEIYADDVKCNHGSTVGQLNDSALFYMAQRGVDPKEGRRLLQQAFAFEVIDRIDIPALRTRLAQMVEERFRRGAGACGDCAMCAAK